LIAMTGEQAYFHHLRIFFVVYDPRPTRSTHDQRQFERTMPKRQLEHGDEAEYFSAWSNWLKVSPPVPDQDFKPIGSTMKYPNARSRPGTAPW